MERFVEPHPPPPPPSCPVPTEPLFPPRRVRHGGRHGGTQQQSHHQRGRRQHDQLLPAGTTLTHPAYALTSGQPGVAAAMGNIVYHPHHAHLKPPRRSWASAPRPVYYQQQLQHQHIPVVPHHHHILQQQQQLHQQQLHQVQHQNHQAQILHIPPLAVPPSNTHSYFPHLLASHYHRLYGPHIHNYNVNCFHRSLVATSSTHSMSPSPTSPGSPNSTCKYWQLLLESYCQFRGYPKPIYTFTSDPRGGRTAWFCKVEIPGILCMCSRFCYAGTENAKEDASEVAYKFLTQPPPQSQNTPPTSPPTSARLQHPQHYPQQQQRQQQQQWYATNRYTSQQQQQQQQHQQHQQQFSPTIVRAQTFSPGGVNQRSQQGKAVANPYV